MFEVYSLLFAFAFLIFPINNQYPVFRCNYDSIKQDIKKANLIVGHNKSKIDENQFKMFNLNSDAFKDYFIHLDLYNFDAEVKKYGLTSKRDFFASGLTKAKKTFERLLKVKPVKNFAFTDKQLFNLNITSWDTTKIGNNVTNKNLGMRDFGIDLYIFVRFGDKKEMGENVLASAGVRHIDPDSGQPLIGVVNINREVDYSKINSLRYLEGILLHEITHILGFSNFFFTEYIHNYYKETDNYGVVKYYINSAKVLSVAKKYFNCDKIKGVRLEEYGGTGTAGSHWDARILLGDYMNGEIYPPEQVISEFTLALLEDTGYYKANYYTGGLLKFGKNKGCDFLNKKCVIDQQVNKKFKNEFFDSIMNDGGVDPGCSSGRQSRAYHFLLQYYEDIPEYYRYFPGRKNYEKIGGKSTADFCPVFNEIYDEVENIYYVGHCSEMGNNDYYGTFVPYAGNKNYTNKQLVKYTGESFSNNSFCALSTLISKNVNGYSTYTNHLRGVCYQMFCSDKSLTIKIFNDYIVCPRGGGKISATNYDGYLLCPDYNLICSGTVMCNDMFDCLDKNSTLKEVKYDYDIKTHQDTYYAETEEFSKDNYELSTNGKCIQYCSQCTATKCLNCGKGYDHAQVKLNGTYTPKCISLKELEHGYYKNNSVYYECLENCDKCSNGTICLKCKSSYKLNETTRDYCVYSPSSSSSSKTFIYVIIIIFAVIIILAGIFIVIRIRQRRNIFDDANKISFHKDNKSENLLYSTN